MGVTDRDFKFMQMQEAETNMLLAKEILTLTKQELAGLDPELEKSQAESVARLEAEYKDAKRIYEATLVCDSCCAPSFLQLLRELTGLGDAAQVRKKPAFFSDRDFTYT